MHLQQRINAFVKLGEFLSQFSNEAIQKKDNIEHNAVFFDGFKHQLKLAEENNGWFTSENIRFSIYSWVEALTLSNLESWLKPYNVNTTNPKHVAIIMAGNIPWWDFMIFYRY